MKNGLLFASLLMVSWNCCAVEFQKDKAGESYNVVNGMSVVTIGADSFVVNQLPDTAYNIATSTNADDSNKALAKLKSGLEVGLPTNEEEISKALEIYYQNIAFDPNSIVIKNMMVGDAPKFVTWCGSGWRFGCLQWGAAAGTVVEFDVNGKNRDGGMTGFTHTILVVKKFSETPAPDAPAAG